MRRPKRVRSLKRWIFVFASIGVVAALTDPGWHVDSFRTNEQYASDECRRRHEQIAAWLKATGTTLPPELPDPDPVSRIVLVPDPWGQPYRIDRGGPRAFRICSNGPDATAGTEDDICYPDREER